MSVTDKLTKPAFPVAEIKDEILKGQCEQLLGMFESFTKDQKTKLDEAFDDFGVEFNFQNIQKTLFEIAKVLSSLSGKTLETQDQNKIDAGKADYNAFGAKVFDLTEGKNPLGIAQTYERLSALLPELKEILDQVGHPEAEAIASASVETVTAIRATAPQALPAEVDERIAMVNDEAEARVIDLQQAIQSLVEISEGFEKGANMFDENSYQLFKGLVEEIKADLGRQSELDYTRFSQGITGRRVFSFTEAHGLLSHAEALIKNHEENPNRRSIEALNGSLIDEIHAGLQRESGKLKIEDIHGLVERLESNLSHLQALTEDQIAAHDILIDFRAQLLEAVILHFALKYGAPRGVDSLNLHKKDVLEMIEKYNTTLAHLQKQKLVGGDVLRIDASILNHEFVGFFSKIRETLPAGQEVIEQGTARLNRAQEVQARLAEVRAKHPTTLTDRFMGNKEAAE